METRRNFIKKSAVISAALCLPVSLNREGIAAYSDLKTRSPKKVLILWYSQTGHTQRYAKLIGCILKEKNLTVDVREFQDTDKKILPAPSISPYGLFSKTKYVFIELLRVNRFY